MTEANVLPPSGTGLDTSALHRTGTRLKGLIFPATASRRALIGLLAIFVISRIFYGFIGVRLSMDFAEVHNYWQVLDIKMLHNQFFKSLMYLHIEPPLFNAYIGLLGFVPPRSFMTVTAICDLVMGGVFVLCSYLLMIELRVPLWIAFIVATFVEISPETILYENWQFYTYPTAVLLTIAALSFIKFWKTSTLR